MITPKYCALCGRELAYTEDKKYDIYTGKEKTGYRFLTCPRWGLGSGEFGHGRYQYMEGNGKNDIWMALER